VAREPYTLKPRSVPDLFIDSPHAKQCSGEEQWEQLSELLLHAPSRCRLEGDA
jgi:hypothetical protein